MIMKKYSIFSLLRNSMSYHENWQKNWRSPDPKSEYDVIIVGGGGHGLATAYYLAKECGITNVAVIEKGWIGGGNTGRNTTIVRSNYLWDESAAIYEHAMKLWEGLSQELNYNVMFSQRGLLHLAHNVHDLQEIGRRGNAIHFNGIDSEFLTPAQVKEMVPLINLNCRYPVLGALLQRRGGNARHDAVAWGYARAADAMGVDIIQNCEVTGFNIENGVVKGVETTRGSIKGKKVGVVTAGHSGVMAEMAGFRLPIESFPLQAMVSEPLKPCINTVIMSGAVHVYISQSDKGELVVGAGSDNFVSYSQRGSFDMIDHIISPMVELFPFTSRLRMMRQWGGIVDVTIDRSPIVSKTPVENLYFNCGWGTGGFKCTPGSGHVFAHSLANGEMHPIAQPFSMNRFNTGALIDEGAAAAVAH
ncbi:heterotetrameric sarcosine oxidase beta subunit [Aestuariispira insulae]|uniref:Sarcosine oxidase subunit beta n=2 Tax=Aestuariispira insulae TaxID=1461337 RepID=A0A3D9HGE0_9PROT|nr:heterotetrameric sarcosine oxidase beta subunit [Aestuariispira insulae]